MDETGGPRRLTVWSVTLGRDVLASALATGVAAFMFAPSLRHEEPVPAGLFGPTGKYVERIGAADPESLGRALRVYDTIALFGTHPTEAAPVAIAAAPARPAPREAEEPTRATLVSVLPPHRPRSETAPVIVAASTPVLPVQGVAERPGPRRIELLGWAVPGSEHIPTGREAIGRLASIGEQVGALGGTILDGVRLP